MKKLMQFIYKENGINKTPRNIFVLVFSPWVIFALSIFINVASDIARDYGINAMKTSIPVVAIGCSIFSVYNVLLYFWKWRRVYRARIAKGRS